MVDEFGVLVTLQGHELEHQWDGQGANTLEDTQKQVRIVDGLRNDEVCSSLDLPLETLELQIKVFISGIEGASCEEIRRGADTCAGGVEASIELPDEVDEPD